jgi:GNAT superfamily N-acetyltransferase
MFQLIKTNSTNKDFIELVQLLDADLAIRDGVEHNFYAQFNKIDAINHVLVMYENKVAIGCGALKHFNNEIMEVKRMYVIPLQRSKGIATSILKALEEWAKELNYKKCILETGNKQPEAIQLYLKNNYQIIPNYAQYAGVANSVCFEKIIA